MAPDPAGFTRGRTATLWALVALYLVAGLFHLFAPGPFLRIVPAWVPVPGQVVAVTGIAELAGALALAQSRLPSLRRAAGWALAAYALCVWPANIQHMLLDMARLDHGWGLAYHVPRLIAQPLLIWAAPWSAGCFAWPWRRTEQPR